MKNKALYLVLVAIFGLTGCGSNRDGAETLPVVEKSFGAGMEEKTEKQPMSADKSSLLNRINELLAAHPARTPDCGEKHTQLHREGDLLVAEVTLSECERSYRFEAPVARLLFDKLASDLVPEYGHGQVYIQCENDEPCVIWKIRDNSGAEWRTVREDPEFVIDLAPDASAVSTLEKLLREWQGS